VTKLSAQVILKPEALKSAALVAEALRKENFVVGPLVANNFSIEASPSLFGRYFGVAHAGPPYELPLDGLPQVARQAIEAVIFTTPPDFGPGGKY
jgi:hypothetical protein